MFVKAQCQAVWFMARTVASGTIEAIVPVNGIGDPNKEGDDDPNSEYCELDCMFGDPPAKD